MQEDKHEKNVRKFQVYSKVSFHLCTILPELEHESLASSSCMSNHVMRL